MSFDFSKLLSVAWGGWTTTWPTELLALIWLAFLASWVGASFWQGRTKKQVMTLESQRYRLPIGPRRHAFFADQEANLPGQLTPELTRLLLVGALASPHPDAVDAAIQPTDVAVVRAAVQAGLEQEIRAPRELEVPFDSARAFRSMRSHGTASW